MGKQFVYGVNKWSVGDEAFRRESLELMAD
jgi:hypothetical protein